MKKKEQDFIKNMPEMERRQFLKALNLSFAAAALPLDFRLSFFDALLGSSAYAAVAEPLNFLEVNFRDQWDFGALFVPPSIANNFENLKNKLAQYETPIKERKNFYLTPDAVDLRPHLDDIAVVETCQCVLPGNKSIHGHEAGNPIRSPGRTKRSGSGRTDMATVDKRPGGRKGGNEILYSSTPTPAVLHNYFQKKLDSEVRNGVLLRSSIRSNIHTFYHFEHNLVNAQLDRYFDKEVFQKAFKKTQNQTQNTLKKHGGVISNLIKRFDKNYLDRVRASSITKNKKSGDAQALAKLITQRHQAIDMTLSSSEQNYWKNGIGGQLVCRRDKATNCDARDGAWNAGELFAHASKLFESGQVKTVAIDFDMQDVHTSRTPQLMRTQAEQSGKTLARLIENLKSKGLWDNTVIAMYTLDGSRSPLSNSTGNGTKNSVILAGGKIKGGYYGDISMKNSDVYYHRPDENGNPVAEGTTGRDKRVAAADIYKTVAKASGIPDHVTNNFPDLKFGKVLNYLLK